VTEPQFGTPHRPYTSLGRIAQSEGLHIFGGAQRHPRVEKGTETGRVALRKKICVRLKNASLMMTSPLQRAKTDYGHGSRVDSHEHDGRNCSLHSTKGVTAEPAPASDSGASSCRPREAASALTLALLWRACSSAIERGQSVRCRGPLFYSGAGIHHAPGGFPS